MELFNEPIIQKKTLGDVIKNDNVITNTTMVGGSFNGGKITIGSGNNIFTANKDGIFLGSSSFDTAPFSVNMLGDVIANSIIITGGSLDGTSTIGGRLCSTVAEAIDANGHFIDDRFDTDSKTILSDFTFGTSGALQIGTYSDGVSGDIRISPNGILGRNKDGDTTFSINGTTGEATFGGTLVAASGTFGTVTAGTLSGVEISGSTITGGTIQTSSTGQRVEIASSNNTITFYNDDGDIVTQMGGGDNVGNALNIKFDSTTTVGMRIDTAQANDIGINYFCSGNYNNTGINLQLTGATNSGIGININHDGSGGEGIYIDTSAGANGIEIQNSGSGESLKIGSSAGESINIVHSSDSHKAIDIDYSGRKEAIYVTGSDANTAEPLIYASATPNTSDIPTVEFNRAGAGSVLNLVNSSATNNNYPTGLSMNIVSTGTAPEVAFRFDGSEYISGATSVSGLTGVIRVYTSEGLGYMPIYSSYS